MLSLLLISIRACFKLFLIELLLLQSVAVAYADTIVPIDYLVPDGSTNTYTDRATNGTPIVNIAAPSGAGVSLNNWEQYNVTNQNQILNNYRGTTVDTNLAGAIYGNPNFAPVGVREARVIVNQVTSSTVSNLNGYVEIAGGKADLVIANPNGINVAGAGFINTGRLSLVSGVAHLDEVGALNNFTLGNGTGASIIITGINTPAYANLGLDIGSVDYSDIISRSVLVLGDIHAKVLEIKTGNKTYDYNSKLIDSEVISGALPSFALDSSYLGGIYAGKITLVATEAGIGVRARGDLVSLVNEVNFNAASDVDYERIQSNTSVDITSGGKITQGKYTSLSRPALTNAKGNIELNGNLGIELNGSYLYTLGSLSLTSNFLVKNNTILDITNNISIEAASFENNFLAQAGNNFTITLEENLLDIAELKAGNNLSVDAKTGITYRDIFAGNNISLTNENSGDITQNKISYSLGTTNITNNAGDIKFLGENVFSNGDLSIITNKNITNDLTGEIFSNQNITLGNATLISSLIGAITNDANIRAVGNITLNSNRFLNNALIQAGNNLTIKLNADLIDTSQMRATVDLRVEAKTGITYNDIIAGHDVILINQLSGNITQNKSSNSGGKTTITNDAAASGILSGNIIINDVDANVDALFATEDLSIAATNLITNNGNIISNKNILISANSLTNNQNIISRNNLIDEHDVNGITISLDENLINNSLIFANRNVNLEVDGFITNSGRSALIFALNGNVNISGKIYDTAHGNVNKYDFFTLSPDKSAVIRAYLRSHNYIDDAGNITDKFKNLTSAGDLETLSAELNPFRDKIYEILSNNSPKFSSSGNDFINSVVKSYDYKAADIYNILKTRGYIKDDNKLDRSFYTDTISGIEGLNLGDNFNCCVSEIYNLIYNAHNGKIFENSFLDLTHLGVKGTATDSTALISALFENQYLDAEGNSTTKFDNLTSASGLNLGASFTSTELKTEVFNKINEIKNLNKISSSTINEIPYTPSDTLDTTSLFDKLKLEGYLDEAGIIQKKYFEQGLPESATTPASIDLAANKSAIEEKLNAANQASFSANNFKNITKPLTDSTNDLIAELKEGGYLDDENKKIVLAIQSDDDLANFLNALDDKYSAALKTEIFNKIKDGSASNPFTSSDFTNLANDPDKILFNENQLLFADLVAKGYLSKHGDPTSALYNLVSANDLNLDSRFTNYKTEIFAALRTKSVTPAKITTANLVPATKTSTSAIADAILQELKDNDYLDNNGNFTAKLMTQVINSSDPAELRYLHLNIGSFSADYAQAVYLELLNHNGITAIKKFNHQLDNLNGAKIISSLGNINIKTLTLNNFAKDNYNVNDSAAVTRNSRTGIASAYKNTVLWGYSEASSNIDSVEEDVSKIQAGNNINIVADNIKNRSSEITAGNNIDIKVKKLENTRTSFNATNSYTYDTHWKRCNITGCKNKRRMDTYSTTSVLTSKKAALLSANSITIDAISDLSLDGKTLSAFIPGEAERSKPATSTAGSPKTDRDDDARGNININIPAAGDTLFKKAAPDSQYLIETDPFLNDPSMLTGSAYYKSRFGFDPDTSQFKWLGDAFYDWNQINQQITQINHKQQLWASDSWEENLNRLIDNAYVQKDDLGLEPGVKLTAAQINKLNSDILWYETNYVNKTTGEICNNTPRVCAANPAYQQTLIPKVYLAKNTFNQMTLDPNSSAIIAKNVTINSSNLINYGQVLATNNLSLNIRNDLNNYSTIYANNNLDITAKNLNNISQINNVNIRNDIYQTINKTAEIKAGSVNIILENSLNNIAANIQTTKNIINQDEIYNATNNNQIFAGQDSIPNYQIIPDKIYSTGNVSITAGNDINIAAAALITHTEYQWGGKKNGNSKITNDINNLGSNIASAGNIILVASGTGYDAEGAKASELYNQEQLDLAPLNAQLQQLKTKLDANKNFLSRKVINSKITNLQNQITDITNKYDSQIAPLIMNIGSNVNIAGSTISASKDININASNDINITNAINSTYNHNTFQKKGAFKTRKSMRVDYVESAVNSNLSADNINLSSNDNILIQASNLDTKNNLSVGELTLAKNFDGSYQKDSQGNYLTTTSNLVNNITIQNATLQEYHNAMTSKSYNGIAGVATKITSTAIGSIDMMLGLTANATFFAPKLMAKLGNEIGIVSDSFVNNIDNLKHTIRHSDDMLTDSSLYNIRQKTYTNDQQINVASSNLNIGNNLNITTSNSVGIQASNITTGTADNTPDKSNSAITGSLNITTQNLNIAAAQEFSIDTYENKKTRTMMNRDRNEGQINGDTINSNIITKNDNLNLNATNQIIISYDSNLFNSNDGILNNNTSEAQGSNYLTYLHNNKDNVFYNPVTKVQEEWSDVNRSLTGAGQAMIAVAAVAAVIVTGGAAGVAVVGAGATAGTMVGGAIATSALTTVSTSAVSTSMNADGSIWDQTKSIGKSSGKALVSEQSLKSMAIAGVTAGLTYGAGRVLSSGSTVANGAENTLSASGNVSNASQFPTSLDNSFTSLSFNQSGNLNLASTTLSNSSSLAQRFGSAIQNSAIQTVSNSVAQSTINGDSLSDTLKQSAKYLIINAAGQIGANEIGGLAHTDQITTAQQLTLHATLGCAMGGAMTGNAGGCGSGAAAGIIGEYVGSRLYNNGNTNLSRETIAQISGLTGALAAAGVSGPDGGDNVFAGNMIGWNAAANNATLVVTGTDPKQKRSSSKDLDPEFRKDVEETFGEKLINFEWTGGNTKEARSEAALKLYELFKNYEFAPNEKLNLIAFSHGGNVLKEFTSLYEGEKKIDNMILLGTPSRPDYNIKFDPTDFGFYSNKVSISDIKDGVQTRGYIDGSVYKGGITIPHDIRMMPGFINVRADQDLGLVNNHIKLPTQKVWDGLVKPYLINK